jgi:pimeloyl-ACP methyl ester carboxylesterase
MKKQTGFAEVNDTRLYYEIAGSGSPLVLIHGITLDTRMWDDQFDTFAEQYKVLRYDVRGFGRSDEPPRTPYAHTDDLRALLAFLDIDHAFVTGLSMGGGIAIDYALAYPEATDALILVDSVLGGYQWTEGIPTEAARARARGVGIAAAKATWLGGPLFAPARENPAVANRLAQMVETYSGWHWVNDNPLRRPDVLAVERLDRIRVPTLIVLGERDTLDLHRIAEILEQRIPGAVRIVLPGVGHMSNMEDPTGFNTAVMDFLAKQQTSG